MGKRKSNPWSIDRLLMEDRNAITVFVAMLVMARGKMQLSTTRPTITKTCGLTGKRITTAIQALHKAGWVRRKLISRGRKSWYLIVFINDILHGGRKATSMQGFRKVEKRPPCTQSHGGRKTTPLLLREEGGESLKAPPTPASTEMPLCIGEKPPPFVDDPDNPIPF